MPAFFVLYSIFKYNIGIYMKKWEKKIKSVHAEPTLSYRPLDLGTGPLRYVLCWVQTELNPCRASGRPASLTELDMYIYLCTSSH
jgi:hypothetical protein